MITIIVLLLIIQSTEAPTVFPQTPPRIRHDRTEDIRQIYAVVLADRLASKGEAPAGTYLVVASDTAVFCNDDNKQGDGNCVFELTTKSIGESTVLPLVSQDLKTALLAANVTSRPVPDLGVRTARLVPSKSIREIFAGKGWWDEFYRKYPSSRGFLEFTSPVFNADEQEALLYVSHSCGGLCGTGWLLHLSRDGLGWKITDRQMLWIS